VVPLLGLIDDAGQVAEHSCHSFDSVETYHCFKSRPLIEYKPDDEFFLIGLRGDVGNGYESFRPTPPEYPHRQPSRLLPRQEATLRAGVQQISALRLCRRAGAASLAIHETPPLSRTAKAS
jgi:hypothetical protein